MMNRKMAWTALVLTGCLQGCAHFTPEDVKPWQRGTLARENMQLVNDANQQALDDHIYFSREAATGGAGLGGGGCGCN